VGEGQLNLVLLPQPPGLSLSEAGMLCVGDYENPKTTERRSAVVVAVLVVVVDDEGEKGRKEEKKAGKEFSVRRAGGLDKKEKTEIPEWGSSFVWQPDSS